MLFDTVVTDPLMSPTMVLFEIKEQLPLIASPELPTIVLLVIVTVPAGGQVNRWNDAGGFAKNEGTRECSSSCNRVAGDGW